MRQWDAGGRACRIRGQSPGYLIARAPREREKTLFIATNKKLQAAVNPLFVPMTSWERENPLLLSLNGHALLLRRARTGMVHCAVWYGALHAKCGRRDIYAKVHISRQHAATCRFTRVSIKPDFKSHEKLSRIYRIFLNYTRYFVILLFLHMKIILRWRDKVSLSLVILWRALCVCVCIRVRARVQ